MVLDLGLPGLNGVEATAEISRVAPGVAILMLTMFDDDADDNNDDYGAGGGVM